MIEYEILTVEELESSFGRLRTSPIENNPWQEKIVASHEALRAYIGDSDMMRESIQALQEMIVKQAHQITELERKVQIWKKDKRRERLIQTLIYHQRLSNGKCYCGWTQLGKSHAEHIVIMFETEER